MIRNYNFSFKSSGSQRFTAWSPSAESLFGALCHFCPWVISCSTKETFPLSPSHMVSFKSLRPDKVKLCNIFAEQWTFAFNAWSSDDHYVFRQKWLPAHHSPPPSTPASNSALLAYDCWALSPLPFLSAAFFLFFIAFPLLADNCFDFWPSADRFNPPCSVPVSKHELPETKTSQKSDLERRIV